MALCQLCELDDSMCAHSAGAHAAAARESAPRRSTHARRRTSAGHQPANSNREWIGEKVEASEFLREPQHMARAAWQIENIWSVHYCACTGCREAEREYLPSDAPERDELSRYSYVALSKALSQLLEFVDHEHPPPLSEWLNTVRQLHRAALDAEASAASLEAAIEDRMASQKPPQRWMGRSPGYYSRGR